MAESSYPSSNPSLLGRIALNAADDQAWQEFAVRYGPKLLAWGVRWGLRDADAHALTDAMLAHLAGAFADHTYTPGTPFRPWLADTARRAWQALAAARIPEETGAALAAMLAAPTAPDEFAAELERSWRQDLLETAMARVRLRVAPATWDAFRLTAVEGLTGAAAAARLGLTLTALYRARGQVQRLLQEERNYLEGVTP